MRDSKAPRVGLKQAVVLAATAAGLVAIGQAPASANGVGSDNTMFKRHFWRGQAYHGAGYHPQVSDIGRDRSRGAVPFEATVIDEPRG